MDIRAILIVLGKLDMDMTSKGDDVFLRKNPIRFQPGDFITKEISLEHGCFVFKAKGLLEN
jgi:hypothetical protein